MKTQFGTLAGGDFEENTMTIEIHGDMMLRAGNYAIVPIDEYNQLANQDKQRELLIGLLQFERNKGYEKTTLVNQEIVDQYLQQLKQAE